MEKVIDITAKRDGFLRCGIAHSDKTTTYPLDQFTKKELERLQKEPQLVVAIRNKDDAGTASTSAKELWIQLKEEREKNESAQGLMELARTQLNESNKKIVQLESDVQTLTSQEADALNKVALLTHDLDAERQRSTDLNMALDAERQTSADLTVKLAAIEKKGK